MLCINSELGQPKTIQFVTKMQTQRRMKTTQMTSFYHRLQMKILIASFAWQPSHVYHLSAHCSYLAPKIKGQGVLFSGNLGQPDPSIHCS